MRLARKNFLSRSRLSENEKRYVRRGDTLDQSHDTAHSVVGEQELDRIGPYQFHEFVENCVIDRNGDELGRARLDGRAAPLGAGPPERDEGGPNAAAAKRFR